VRLSIDASAVPTRPAGAGRYVLELVAALGARPEVGLVVVARRGDGARWRERAPLAEVVEVAPVPRPLRLAWEQADLWRLLERLDVDVHHSPHYTMPELSRRPVVVTVHDLTVFDHPGWHERSKVAVFRRAVRVAARRAAALVVVSETTAARLDAVVGTRRPVFVAHHGVDCGRYRPVEDAPGADQEARRALGVHAPYVLFVGTLEPRKDVPGLLAAFDRMCLPHPGLHLVLAGGDGWAGPELEDAFGRLRHPERVQRLGYVPEDSLPALLRGAAALAYPSREEGFGLPVLEALACGTQVVTTRGSAMEEVASGAALLVPPGDVDALAGALDMVVRGDANLEQRRRRGLEVAEAHSWASAAEVHLRAYRAALAEVADPAGERVGGRRTGSRATRSG